MAASVNIALVNIKRGGMETIENEVSPVFAASYCERYNALAIAAGSDLMAVVCPTTINATITETLSSTVRGQAMTPQTA